MKKTVITLVITLAAAFAAFGADRPLTDAEIADLVRSAPTEKDRPGDDAVVLFEGIFHRATGAGVEVRHQRLVKIYTEWAIEQLGDPRVTHDRERQALVVHASRTYFPDGTFVDTPDNGFNDVTPDGLDLAADHIGIREMVVTHIGLEPEVTIFLDWTVKDTAAAETPFQKLYFLNGKFPALEEVIVAEGLFGETMNVPSALYPLPRPEMSGDKLVWEVKDVPAAPSNMLGHDGDMLAWIVVSATDEWSRAIRALGVRISDAAEARAGLASELGEAMKDDPPVDGRDALAKAAAFVAERTAPVGYEPWSYMSAPRTVERALATSYATPLERAVLVLACCREQGLPARVVIPARWRFVSPFVPAFELLGAPVVAADDEAGVTWWVDPDEGDVSALPPFRGGHEVFVIDGDRADRSRVLAGENVVELSVSWDLGSGEARSAGTIRGEAAREMKTDEADGAIRDWMAGWTDGAEAGSVRLLEASPRIVRFEAEGKAPFPEKDESGFVSVPLPLPPVDIAALLPTAPDLWRSEYDGVLFGHGPVKAHVHWRVRLPEGYELVRAGEAEVRGGRGIFIVKSVADEGAVDIECRLIHEGVEVPPAEYAGFRNLLLGLTDERNTRLVLRRTDDES